MFLYPAQTIISILVKGMSFCLTLSSVACLLLKILNKEATICSVCPLKVTALCWRNRSTLISRIYIFGHLLCLYTHKMWKSQFFVCSVCVSENTSLDVLLTFCPYIRRRLFWIILAFQLIIPPTTSERNLREGPTFSFSWRYVDNGSFTLELLCSHRPASLSLQPRGDTTVEWTHFFILFFFLRK